MRSDATISRRSSRSYISLTFPRLWRVRPASSTAASGTRPMLTAPGAEPGLRTRLAEGVEAGQHLVGVLQEAPVVEQLVEPLAREAFRDLWLGLDQLA